MRRKVKQMIVFAIMLAILPALTACGEKNIMQPSETENSGNLEPPSVEVRWAEDADIGYNEIVVSTEEPMSHILFTSDREVENFMVLNLNVKDADAEGNLYFTASPASEKKVTLLPDMPVVVGLTFHGDLPAWGIQYMDETGQTYYYTLEISGEDGAPFLSEIAPERIENE